MCVPCTTGLYNRVETEPGLDKFVDDPTALQERGLEPLLAWARAVVPRRQQLSAPIFLFATAGARKLPAAKQEQLLEDVRAVLASSGFR